MIAGFVVGAGDPETVLIRAVGPSLAEIFPSGVSGLLKQPVLSLFDSTGNLVMTNKGWTTGNATAAIMSAAGAFPLLPKSADSALLATLPAGSYTAQVSGLNATTGVALLEVYEVNATSSTARLINLSTRGEVGTGNAVMIPGISIAAGDSNRTLLIRAAGPALSALGVQGALLDPTIIVKDSSGAVIASNDNWESPVGNAKSAAALTAAFTQTGAFPFGSNSLDAALIGTFPPGSYTVVVSGNSGETGVSLVEVYDMTSNTPDTLTIAATQPNADTSGANPGEFTVTRTGDATGNLNVGYSIGGSAIDGIDYQGLSGIVTIAAGATSATIPVRPNASLSNGVSSTVVVTLNPASAQEAYGLGATTSATVTIKNIAPTLYVAQLRPVANASGSTGTGVATVLVSADGSLASVSVSFSNLSSDEVVAHLAIGGDMNNGTYVLNLPDGQVNNLQWTPTGAGQYTAAQVLAALTSGNLFVEIDSSQFPSGELGGQFITGLGSQVFIPPAPPPAIDLSSVSDPDAPRFFTQATFGPTTPDIVTLQTEGYSGWIWPRWRKAPPFTARPRTPTSRPSRAPTRRWPTRATARPPGGASPSTPPTSSASGSPSPFPRSSSPRMSPAPSASRPTAWPTTTTSWSTTPSATTGPCSTTSPSARRWATTSTCSTTPRPTRPRARARTRTTPARSSSSSPSA